MTLKATAKQRSNFAVQHLMSAARFARLCYEVEKANMGNPFGPFYDEVISYVTATVFSSVAALESNINEIVADAQDGFISFSELSSKEFLKETWNLIENRPILEKYQFILVLQGKSKMKKGEYDYQAVDTLITVRNALVHFKPEWNDEQQIHDKIGKKLRGKFKLSPFLDKGAPLFPMRCMTHGLADWAVSSSLAFADSFSKKAGITCRFEQFKKRIITKTV